MKTTDALNTLTELDNKFGQCVYTKNDLRVIFHNESERGLEKSLSRLTKSGVLERVAKGVYVFSHTKNSRTHLIENIAHKLRFGEVNYISLESALSQYGQISQIPVGLLTVMTTGREGKYKTPYGVIEFTHTKRNVSQVLKRCSYGVNHPLAMATETAALEDLKRVGRNVNMLTH